MLRTVAALLALTTPTAFAFTAAELATKNVEAKGGIDKIDAIRSLRLAGTLRVNGDTLELALVTLVKRPHSIRNEATVQGSAPALYSRMSLPFLDPAYMPVTRDLSPAKIQMILQWLKTYLPAQETKS